MKLLSLHIVLFFSSLPFIGLSQTAMEQNRFYTDLGIRDATHELSLVNLNVEDERDFWVDQKAFEVLLEKGNPVGHQSYLDGKHSVYREHQIHCGERCDHSDAFSTHMAFYLINGNSNANVEVVLTIKKSGNN